MPSPSAMSECAGRSRHSSKCDVLSLPVFSVTARRRRRYGRVPTHVAGARARAGGDALARRRRAMSAVRGRRAAGGAAAHPPPHSALVRTTPRPLRAPCAGRRACADMHVDGTCARRASYGTTPRHVASLMLMLKPPFETLLGPCDIHPCYGMLVRGMTVQCAHGTGRRGARELLAPAAERSLSGAVTGAYTSTGALLAAARASLCEHGAFIEHHILLPGALDRRQGPSHPSALSRLTVAAAQGA